MTSKIRKLLYPLSVIYGAITGLRNKLYDKGVIKSNEFDIPLIVVGNLRVGGTGKTPQVAYLVDLLKDQYKIAVLSRGYKRKTKGFVLANKAVSANDIGDEPYQLFRQHSDIIVAVDEDRSNGINSLLAQTYPPEIIILDDAFQHRKIKPGFTILLTPYDDLYSEDLLLPAGNLREHQKGADRAQLLVVSKCPVTINEAEEYEIASKLNPSLKQTVFFTAIKYTNYVQNDSSRIEISKLKNYEILLVTGIADPKPLVGFIDKMNLVFTHLSYPDHHNFSRSDIKKIKLKFRKISNKNKLILTTEKDYVRIFESLDNLYYLAIKTTFINHQKDFDKLIIDYVEKNTGNRKISKG